MPRVKPAKPDAGLVPLGQAALGARGVIVTVGPATDTAGEIEHVRRLLEFGFVEGARVEILHQGVIGRDPIAVKLDDMRIGLRRAYANDVLIRLDPAA